MPSLETHPRSMKKYVKHAYYDDGICTNYTNYTTNAQRPGYRAKSLDMGVYLKPDIFVSEAKYIYNVDFTIDYQYRDIKIEFDVPMDKRVYRFKLEINFNNLDGEFHVELDSAYGRSQITIAS